jgi:hypothetical protein
VTNRTLPLAIVAAVLALPAADMGAQPSASTRRVSNAPLTVEELLPMTCVQAWVAAGKRYPDMRSIVTTLAKVSLVNRDLTFPTTREAGMNAGQAIAEECKADPGALLYAVVDKQVRRLGAPTTPSHRVPK